MDCTSLTSITIPASVTLSGTSFTYTGSPITPAVTIKYHDVTLTEGKDYTLSYRNSNKAGTATVIITGTGDNYTGTTTRTFTLYKGKNSIYTDVDSITKKWSAKKQTVSLNPFVFDSPKLTYKSSDPANVAVSSGGKVTIKAGYVGKATITITAPETAAYRKATEKITVTVKKKVSRGPRTIQVRGPIFRPPFPRPTGRWLSAQGGRAPALGNRFPSKQVKSVQELQNISQKSRKIRKNGVDFPNNLG